LNEGKVYTPERIEVALEHFFKTSNLNKLRELTLRELASQIDLRRRDTVEGEEEDSAFPDQVMVCLSSRGPNSEKLLRYTSRLAGRLNRNWYAVYVQTPSEDPMVIDVHTQDNISNTLTLAKQLGAIVFTYKGEDIVHTLLQFAKEYRVGHLVIGSPTPRSLWEVVRGRTGVVNRLIHEGKGINITVLDTREEERPQIQPSVGTEKKPTATPPVPVTVSRLSLPQLLSSERIVIWNNPVTKEEVLKRLAKTVEERDGAIDTGKVLNAILKREEQGSTFFNEGMAFPHARIEGLADSIVSLGLIRQGVSNEPTKKPISLVFLILSPSQNPDEQIKLLALTSHASQNRHLQQRLQLCRTPEEVIRAIRQWDWEEEQKRLNSSMNDLLPSGNF
jgi:two-component system sensor histidine kinase KdpD